MLDGCPALEKFLRHKGHEHRHVGGGKAALNLYSLFKLYHILSVVRNQSCFFLCLPKEQHIQQIFHLVLLL